MKKFMFCASLLASSFFFFGCSESDSPSNNQTTPGTAEDVVIDTAALQEKALKSQDLVTLTADETTAYAKALNTLTLDMSKRVLNANDNGVFSGFSLHTAFDMLYQGSVDTTKDELSKHMGFNADLNVQAKIGSGMRNLLRFDGQDDNAKMTIANRVFRDKEVSVKDAFANVLSTYYHSPVQEVEFSKPEVAAKIINEYVKINTMEMIKDFVTPGDVSGLSLTLINTVALRAKWAEQFVPDKTQKADFKAVDGSTVQKEFMNSVRDAHYYKVDGQYEALRLDYVGEKYQMLFVLPSDKLENLNLTADSFAEMHRKLNEDPKVKIEISLPKVKIDSPKMDLADHLKALGINSVFKGGLNNVSGDPKLALQTVIQKAIIEWNEVETKAAAATMLGMSTVAIYDGPTIKFNRPFAFYLVHKASGAILFNGQLVK